MALPEPDRPDRPPDESTGAGAVPHAEAWFAKAWGHRRQRLLPVSLQRVSDVGRVSDELLGPGRRLLGRVSADRPGSPADGAGLEQASSGAGCLRGGVPDIEPTVLAREDLDAPRAGPTGSS